jgi:hypothetical protein
MSTFHRSRGSNGWWRIRGNISVSDWQITAFHLSFASKKPFHKLFNLPIEWSMQEKGRRSKRQISPASKEESNLNTRCVIPGERGFNSFLPGPRFDHYPFHCQALLFFSMLSDCKQSLKLWHHSAENWKQMFLESWRCDRKHELD